MRRVLAISFAILIVMLATRGVMAQDAEQSVSDRLLEILKDRQIISGDEYGELKGLATEMQAERAELNTRLGDLDRSITEYLAKDDAALGSNVTYQIGKGFTFATQDGNFALTIGGMFKFMYQGINRDRNPFGCDNDCYDDYFVAQVPGSDSVDRRDVNNFWLDNRFHFEGHAFDPNLTYYFEFMAGDWVGLYEGWVNYNVCDWFNVKGGLQRVPTGRQALIHQSDLAFGNRAWESISSYGVNAGMAVPSVDGDMWPDVNQQLGISVWNLYEDIFQVMGDEGFAAEYSMGIYNGYLAANNNWVSPAFRLAIHPFGYVPYVEGDWTSSADPKFALGVNYGNDVGTPDLGEKTTFYSWDAVFTWSGLYLTGEWHRDTYTNKLISIQKQRSWFLQAGYMVLPQELELLVRYTTRGAPLAWQDTMEKTSEWSGGVAYYFEGHHLKGILEFGQQKTELGNAMIVKDPKVGFFRVTFQLEW
jgi:hypothetical protein